MYTKDTNLSLQMDMYKNPLYSENMHQTVFFPSISIRKLQLWNGYYLRWNPRMRPQEAEFERCRQLQVLIKLVSACISENYEINKKNSIKSVCDYV